MPSNRQRSRLNVQIPAGLMIEQLNAYCDELIGSYASSSMNQHEIRATGLTQSQIRRDLRQVRRDIERYVCAVNDVRTEYVSSDMPSYQITYDPVSASQFANDLINETEMQAWYRTEVSQIDSDYANQIAACCEGAALENCDECRVRINNADSARNEALLALDAERTRREQIQALTVRADLLDATRYFAGSYQVPIINSQGIQLTAEAVERRMNEIRNSPLSGEWIINDVELTPEQVAEREERKRIAKEFKKKEREERMGRIKDLKTQVSHGKAADLHRLIRCGFELETQESKGLTQDSTPIDERIYEAAISEQAGYILQDKSYILRFLTDLSMAIPGNGDISAYVNSRTGRMKDNFKTDLGEENYELLKEKSIDLARQNINRRDYRMSIEKMFDELELVEAGSDGSVAGFEFRTMGPNTIKTFNKAAREIFKLSHEIDEKCSFHIHLSVDGLEHSYGETLQLLLMEGVLKQADKVPATVLSRWRRGFSQNESASRYTEIGNYFKWTVNHDKYQAVSKHTEYDTWEFRCFGNVQNYKDAKQCLKIAINALKYAYERQLVRGGPGVLTADNSSAVAKEIANLISWDDVVEKYGDHAELHAA